MVNIRLSGMSLIHGSKNQEELGIISLALISSGPFENFVFHLTLGLYI